MPSGCSESVWKESPENRRQKNAGGKSRPEKVTGLEGFEGCNGSGRQSGPVKSPQTVGFTLGALEKPGLAGGSLERFFAP
jgi:hypothetical protein